MEFLYYDSVVNSTGSCVAKAFVLTLAQNIE